MSSEPQVGATTRLQESAVCALVQDLLPLYIEQEVSSASREMIANHVAQCERCADYLAGARSMRQQLQREGQSRQHEAAQDYTTRQAVSLGRRRLAGLFIAVGLGIAGLFAAFLILFTLFGINVRSTQTMPVLEYSTSMPAFSEEEFMPTAVPPSWPTATPVPFSMPEQAPIAPAAPSAPIAP